MQQGREGVGSNQALARGLTVLRALVDEGAPVTSTEIARRIGLHQSSASRILATLTDAGFVRKTGGGFAPDYGVLSLASAASQFPLIQRPREAMEQLAARCAPLTVTLGMLWRRRMIYFLRTTKGAETIDFWWSDFPIHISAPGLRLLVDRPREQALEILRDSRRDLGWDAGSATVPATEEGVLDWATKTVAHDVLVVPGWHRPETTSAAIPIDGGDEHPVALALAGRSEVADVSTLQLWLHDGRRAVEAALRGSKTVP